MKQKVAFMTLSLLLALGLAGCGSDTPEAQQNEQSKNSDTNQKDGADSEHATILANAGWTIEPFRFTDENGKQFGMSDLKGKIWLANMIFTSCETVCPPMTANMANIQSKLKEQDLTIPIVSFSVDPKRDSEKKLKAFGQKFNADFSTWHFLTGYSPKDIKKFAKTSFKSAVSPIANTDQFAHSTSFFLINQSGEIMAKYDGLTPPKDTIVKHVKNLKKSKGMSLSADGHMDMDMDQPSAEKPVSVKIQLQPKQIKPGQQVTIKAVVTQEDENVNDANEVLFEVWKKGEDEHEKIKGKSKGNGVYSIKNTFDASGTYYIMSHVTARGQHTMPKKTIKVGD